MRRAQVVLAVLALATVVTSVVFGIMAALHPVQCPGAFIGCPQNGEERAFSLGILAIAFSSLNSLLAFIWAEMHGARNQKTLYRALFFFAVLFFPVPIGLFFTIIAASFLPGFGLYLYLFIPVVLTLTILFNPVRQPTLTSAG